MASHGKLFHTANTVAGEWGYANGLLIFGINPPQPLSPQDQLSSRLPAAGEKDVRRLRAAPKAVPRHMRATSAHAAPLHRSPGLHPEHERPLRHFAGCIHAVVG